MLKHHYLVGKTKTTSPSGQGGDPHHLMTLRELFKIHGKNVVPLWYDKIINQKEKK